MKYVDKAYQFFVPPAEIPDCDLPKVYRSVRSLWVIHLKKNQMKAVASLKPMMDDLRTELKRRKLSRIA